MAPMLSNCVFVSLLPMLAILLACAGVANSQALARAPYVNSEAGSAPGPSVSGLVNVTLSIESEMGAGTNLSVDCWRLPMMDRHHQWSYIDFGERGLGNQELYSFTFTMVFNATRDYDRRIYSCKFNAVGFPEVKVWVHVGAFYPFPKDPACKCVESGCALWEVKPEGFFCGGQKVRTWYGKLV